MQFPSNYVHFLFLSSDNVRSLLSSASILDGGGCCCWFWLWITFHQYIQHAYIILFHRWCWWLHDLRFNLLHRLLHYNHWWWLRLCSGCRGRRLHCRWVIRRWWMFIWCLNVNDATIDRPLPWISIFETTPSLISSINSFEIDIRLHNIKQSVKNRRKHTQSAVVVFLTITFVVDDDTWMTIEMSRYNWWSYCIYIRYIHLWISWSPASGDDRYHGDTLHQHTERKCVQSTLQYQYFCASMMEYACWCYYPTVSILHNGM